MYICLPGQWAAHGPRYCPAESSRPRPRFLPICPAHCPAHCPGPCISHFLNAIPRVAQATLLSQHLKIAARFAIFAVQSVIAQSHYFYMGKRLLQSSHVYPIWQESLYSRPLGPGGAEIITMGGLDHDMNVGD